MRPTHLLALVAAIVVATILSPISSRSQNFDLAVTSVVAPAGTLAVGAPVLPRAAVRNAGPAESIPASLTFTIKSASGTTVYGPVSVTLDAIPPGQQIQASSSQSWSPQPGSYQVIVACAAAGDVSRANDTARGTCAVQPPILTRAQAIAIVDTGVIARSPHATALAAFLYNRAAADSLLHAGSRVLPRDSSFIDTLVSDAYLFWLDDRPGGEWLHPATFAYVDARSGAITVREAESWPVVNDQEITRFTEQGNASLELFRGSYPADTGRVEVNSVETANNNDWAVIVVGKNLDGAAEETARRNDAARIVDCLNRVALGPQVSGGNIKVVPGANYRGATLKEVCDTLDSLKGKVCNKLFFYYIGHGAKGHMVLKKGTSGTEDFTYKELACKLLALGVPEVCITIEACHSGSAIKPVNEKDTTIGGKKMKLKGTIVTSSSADNTTGRDRDGTPFIKAMNACCKDTGADLNKDGKVTLVEAVAWARARNAAVTRDAPQGKVLGDGDTIVFLPPQSSDFACSEDGGGTLHFELVGTYYKIVRKRGNRTTDSIVCRQTLYVENRAGDVHAGTRELEVICFDERGRPRVLATLPRLVIRARSRLCLIDIPADCRRVEVHRKRGMNVERRDALGRIALLLSDSAGTSLERRGAVYRPGELIFQNIETDPNSSRSYLASVTPVAGWNLAVDDPFYVSAPSIGSAIVVRGTVPDTAKSGGVIETRVIGLDPADTSELRITALLLDTARSGVPSGLRRYRAMERSTDLTLNGGALLLEGSLLSFTAGSLFLVAPAAALTLDHSTLLADSTTSLACRVSGTLDITEGSIVGAANGLMLESPLAARIRGGAILLSRADGLTLRGSQAATDIDFLLIDESASNGLRCDSVGSFRARHLRILGSGASDVALRGGSDVTLLDCSFNDSVIAIDRSSRLTRAWSTGFRLVDRSGNPIRGAEVIVTDRLGLEVARDTTGADGLTDDMPLAQYVQGEASRQARTPHQVRIVAAGRDTVLEHEAILETIRTIELPPSIVGEVEAGPLAAGGIILERSYPNPCGGAHPLATIPFTIARPATAALVLCDPLGRELLRRDLGSLPAGPHAFTLDVSSLSAGAYIYELRTTEGRARGKMVVE